MMTCEAAKKELERSKELSEELNMTVYTIFKKDMITNEVNMIRTMFSDCIEAGYWYSHKEGSLLTFNVCFAAYVSDTFITSNGSLFDESDL